jgi:hypothetical protein
VPHDLGRALLLADAVTSDALAHALFASVRDGVSLVRALVATHAIEPERLDAVLARNAPPDVPVQKHPVPVLELLDKLPPTLCEALVAIPVKRDARTGTVDVALADPNDAHAAEEIAFFLGAPVRAVRSPLVALEAALTRVRSLQKMRAAASSSRPPPPAPEESEEDERPTDVDGHFAPTSDASRAGSGHDIPIPLSQRRLPAEPSHAEPMRPPAETDEPVVELRRVKTPPPSAPPGPGSTRSAVYAAQLEVHLEEMRKLTARDPLGELVLLALRNVAPRAALFAVKKEGFTGWLCTADFGDRARFQDVIVPARAPSFLSAAATVGQYVGPVPKNEHHNALAVTGFLPRKGGEVLAVAVRAASRPVVLLVAYDADPIKAMPVLHDVARVAGETLEKIVLQARQAPPSQRR